MKLSAWSVVVVLLLVFAFSTCLSVGRGVNAAPNDVPSVVKVGACLTVVGWETKQVKVVAVEGAWVKITEEGTGIWVNLGMMQAIGPCTAKGLK
jgi:hypothetical protein